VGGKNCAEEGKKKPVRGLKEGGFARSVSEKKLLEKPLKEHDREEGWRRGRREAYRCVSSEMNAMDWEKGEGRRDTYIRGKRKGHFGGEKGGEGTCLSICQGEKQICFDDQKENCANLAEAEE